MKMLQRRRRCLSGVLGFAGLAALTTPTLPVAAQQVTTGNGSVTVDLGVLNQLGSPLTQGGYAASVRQGPVGEQLCQQHCPVAHVAHEFPQLCEAETEVISQVLGRHVQRLATIAHGDGVCTTFIPTPSIPMSQKSNTSHTSHLSSKEHERLTS